MMDIITFAKQFYSQLPDPTNALKGLGTLSTSTSQRIKTACQEIFQKAYENLPVNKDTVIHGLRFAVFSELVIATAIAVNSVYFLIEMVIQIVLIYQYTVASWNNDNNECQQKIKTIQEYWTSFCNSIIVEKDLIKENSTVFLQASVIFLSTKTLLTYAGFSKYSILKIQFLIIPLDFALNIKFPYHFPESFSFIIDIIIAVSQPDPDQNVVIDAEYYKKLNFVIPASQKMRQIKLDDADLENNEKVYNCFINNVAINVRCAKLNQPLLTPEEVLGVVKFTKKVKFAYLRHLHTDHNSCIHANDYFIVFQEINKNLVLPVEAE